MGIINGIPSRDPGAVRDIATLTKTGWTVDAPYELLDNLLQSPLRCAFVLRRNRNAAAGAALGLGGVADVKMGNEMKLIRCLEGNRVATASASVATLDIPTQRALMGGLAGRARAKWPARSYAASPVRGARPPEAPIWDGVPT